MSNQSLLETLEQKLRQAGVDCALMPTEDQTPSQLIIYGGGSPQQEQLVAITAQTMESGSTLFSGAIEKDKPYARIQIEAHYPFIVEDLAMSEVSQFLHFLNLQVDTPGFFLDHFNKSILYRFIFLCDQENPPWQMILTVLGTTIFFLDAFGGTLNRLSTNKATFAEVLEELLKTITKITH